MTEGGTSTSKVVLRMRKLGQKTCLMVGGAATLGHVMLKQRQADIECTNDQVFISKTEESLRTKSLCRGNEETGYFQCFTYSITLPRG